MKEALMHYVWHHKLWPALGALRTVDGFPVEIISQGTLNTASGPDFTNAIVKIGGQIWAGDIEMHVNASDWHRHGHDADPAYRCVVLHVVAVSDTRIARNGNSEEWIDQMVLPLTPELEARYKSLVPADGHEPKRAPDMLPCGNVWNDIPRLHLTDWLTTLAVERLYERADRLRSFLDAACGDMEQLAFIIVARALGFGINAEPMERLARTTPLSVVYKHTDSLMQVEAILFGQAGLLSPEAPPASYAGQLLAEYRFLAAKYGLVSLSPEAWKLSGMRPGRFPYRSIARLAAILCNRERLCGRLLQGESSPEEKLRAVFETARGAWWQSHYSFKSDKSDISDTSDISDEEANREPERLSSGEIALLRINVMVPLQMVADMALGNIDAAERAVEALEDIPPERNSMTAVFARYGVKIASAADSQALLHLRRAYCTPRKCLRCRVGHRMLAAAPSA